MVRPHYSREDRTAPTEDRLTFTQRIARLHQPMEQEIDVFQRIDRCIRWSYADRSPFDPSTIAGLVAERNGNPGHVGSGHPHTYGFSILGVSGLGKSTSVETILSYYPQVIRHSSYHGVSFEETQVTWLKIDCPSDGRPKGLCLSFFQKLDELVGTSYFMQNCRRALDPMMTTMACLCRSFHIGVLIIDEIQHLCTAKVGVSSSVLNFLVSIVNQTGIPVITVGTPKALSILQSEFQQAKRGCGQGDSLWERMENGMQWKVFCQSLWQYQYTRNEIPLSDGVADALYDEALGVPFLAVHIYKLTQEDAILSEKESFSAKDLRRVARDKMKLTAPMRKAIRTGTEVDLKQFVDITPFSPVDRFDNYSIAAEVRSPASNPSAPGNTPIEKAVSTLMGLGLSYADAGKYAKIAAAMLEGEPPHQVIAVNGWELYQKTLKKPSVDGKDSPKPALTGFSGYDDIKNAGLIDNDYGGNA